MADYLNECGGMMLESLCCCLFSGHTQRAPGYSSIYPTFRENEVAEEQHGNTKHVQILQVTILENINDGYVLSAKLGRDCGHRLIAETAVRFR
jgi:hypothetical protein